MLKTTFKQIAKVLKGKLNKSGLGEKLAKYPNYLAKSKEIWAMINEDLKISDTVENKLILKVDKFEKALFTKFPELTKDNATELIQSIVGEFNIGKEVVLRQVDALKKLQDENAKLKNQLSKFQTVETTNTVTASTIDVKQEKIQG